MSQALWTTAAAKDVLGKRVVAVDSTHVRDVVTGAVGIVNAVDGRDCADGFCRVYVDWGHVQEYLSPREFNELVEVVE